MERAAIFRVLVSLRSVEQKSTGKLHAELFPGGEMSRNTFEEVLGAMARAGLARMANAIFEKDGKQISYRTISLTPAGRATDKNTPIEFIMKEAAAPPTNRKRKKETSTSQKRRNQTAVKDATVRKLNRTPAAMESLNPLWERNAGKRGEIQDRREVLIKELRLHRKNGHNESDVLLPVQ